MKAEIEIICAHDLVCRMPIKEFFFLPKYWYKRVVPDLWRILRRSKLIEQYSINTMLTGPMLAICSNRSIIDKILQFPVEIGKLSDICQGLIYSDIGLVLHDLGFQQEGDIYLEKSIKIYFRSQEALSYDFALSPCFRFNRKENWVKRKEYVKRLIDFLPDNPYLKQLQIKALIDLNELVEAEEILKELMSLHRDYGEFLQADLFFAQGNYTAAVDTYRKFVFPDMYHFWRPQYDYKEAVALFKVNQSEKWRKKAFKMGQRLAWDRFYLIENLESEGVERISKIDEVINASRNEKKLFYPEQVFLFIKRLPRVIFELFFIYRFAVLYCVIGIVFLCMLAYTFARRA